MIKKTITLIVVVFFSAHEFVAAQQWTGFNDTTSPIRRAGQVAIGDANGMFGNFSVVKLSDHAGITLEAGNTKNGFFDFIEGGALKHSFYWDGPIDALRFRNFAVGPMIFTVNNGSEIEGLRIKDDGNVGIGTPTPAYKLDVNGVINSTGILINGVPFAGGGSQWATSGTTISYTAGNVGIGTASPGSFRLAVEGKVGAREFHVTTTNPWPDYVFDRSYKLRPLSEVEEFISRNKHLPEMPSASEIETAGHQLGEMDALMLKKIEELTLYILDQEKKIKNQDKKIREFEVQLKSITEGRNAVDHKSKK
jgi:hypothetical protein